MDDKHSCIHLPHTNINAVMFLQILKQICEPKYHCMYVLHLSTGTLGLKRITNCKFALSSKNHCFPLVDIHQAVTMNQKLF